MADSQVVDMTEATSYTVDDVFYLVDDPNETPSDRKLTADTLFGSIPLDHINFQTKTPALSTSVGKAGDIAWDASYIYVCVSTDTWKRVAISTW